MKKIKQFSLKAMLLTIVAALTIGFTGCSDELSGDQTQGKPGYLTINVKTLKPRASKVPGTVATDYALMKDLNVFIFDGNAPAANMLQHKYVTGTFNTSTSLSMQVGTLTAASRVVVVANYGGAITGVTTYADLTAKEIETVRDFSTLGLHMTGEANVSGLTGGAYTSYVNVAPVESKITVGWTLTDDAANYVVTGVYVVNAINKTKLPIIRTRSHNSDDWTTTNNAADIIITSTINAGTRTASYGLAPEIGRDYNFYTDMTDLSTYLKDETTGTFDATTGICMNNNADSLDGFLPTGGFHYYMGENYHADLPTAGSGALIDNGSANANTIVVIRVTPRSDAPDYIKLQGHKYYTYDFSKSITNNVYNYAGALIPTWDATKGFSTRRKTNYNLTFNLTSIGSTVPFVHLKTLTVNVTADPWENSTVGF